MLKAMIALLAVLALVGCNAQQKPADTAAQTPATSAPGTPAPAAGTDAAAAVAPTLIAELTDQKLIYECPKCGMMFDAAGTCSMGCATLVATQVEYTCPKDSKPVERAGTCPRCPMNARVEKTAMAEGAPTRQ